MKKKILYCDLDGTIADFEKEMNLNIPGWRNMTEEEVDERVTQMCLDNPNIFHNLEPLPNAVETVKKLFDHFEVYFLSTPMWKSPESFTGKRLWIEEHFGDLAIKRLILSHRKDLNIGDYLIDDRTHNGAGEFTGEHIHFGTEKFPTWESVYNYLTEPKDERMVGMTISEKTGKVVTTYAVNSTNFDKNEVDNICKVYTEEEVFILLASVMSKKDFIEYQNLIIKLKHPNKFDITEFIESKKVPNVESYIKRLLIIKKL